MLVRLHRWQPKSKRYRTQNFNLDADSGNSFFGLLGMTAYIEGLPMVKVSEAHIQARTQQIDMIEVDSFNKKVEVWMSPGVERNYRHAGKRNAAVEDFGGGVEVHRAIAEPAKPETCIICGEIPEKCSCIPDF